MTTTGRYAITDASSTAILTDGSRLCFCVGDDDCCIERSRRDREEALREEGRQEERVRQAVRRSLTEFADAYEQLRDDTPADPDRGADQRTPEEL